MRPSDHGLEVWVRRACDLGASAAALLPTATVIVHDHLAALCRPPRCDAYGMSASCPPHVGGTAAMRSWLPKVTWALCLKIDVPTRILMSDARMPVYRRLHQIVATIEREAGDQGCPLARAFAGGNCKRIFCNDQPDCRVVVTGRPCRHPHHARPSMSGFGIDVAHLMQAAGWQLPRITQNTDPTKIPMGSLSGLVLLR